MPIIGRLRPIWRFFATGAVINVTVETTLIIVRNADSMAILTAIDRDPGCKGVVETAYEHYRTVFENALDAYVECVSAADLSASAFEGCERFLAERAEIGAPGHREQFRDALAVVRSGDEC